MINSKYSTHKLTWCFGKYTKTFSTPVSGLPELFFDKRFRAFKSYCLKVGSPIPTYKSFGLSVVPYDEDKIDSDNMLFMSNGSIIFNSGQGGHETVKYIGPTENDSGLKHQIKKADDTEFLVDEVMLRLSNQPDISSVPVTAEQYVLELPMRIAQL